MHVFGTDSDPADVRRAIDAREHFWLDLPDDAFGAGHPAAVALGIGGDELRRLHSRKDHAGAYAQDDHVVVAFAGAVRAGEGIEPLPVLLFAGATGVITLRDGACRPLDALRDSPRDVDGLAILAALTESMSQVADEIGEAVEQAESHILQPRPRGALNDLTTLRQQVSSLLKVVREQRGMVDRSQEELVAMPAGYGDAERRVRDLDGRLARAVYAAESARQTIAEALNLYISRTGENLTRIATVLLPLTVVSGFFGMNFTWMVDHIDSFWSFAVFGVGGMVASVAGVRLYLRRKGYA
jgi:magnesium transporter